MEGRARESGGGEEGVLGRDAWGEREVEGGRERGERDRGSRGKSVFLFV